MNEKIKAKSRPLSHNPLLNFSHDEHFLYSNPKFMNEELWKRKYNLRNLHRKWKRKVKTNFLNIDLKFGRSKNKNDKLNQIIYKENDFLKQYNIEKLFPLSPTIKNKSAIILIDNEKYKDKYNDKYNDKISYYLNNKNPWNNRTSIDRNSYNVKSIKRINRTKNEILIRNNLKNKNESKNIIVNCKYYNSKYIQRIQILKELINKYEQEMLQQISKKFEKEIKLERNSKHNFKYFLLFKEMLIKYQKLYKSLKLNKPQLFRKCNSEINLLENKNKKNIENNNIYEELYIIINYLKTHKEILDTQKDKEIIIKNYIDVIEKDEYLRDKHLPYQIYILNFGKINENDNKENQKEKENISQNILNNKRKTGSCLNLINNKKMKMKYIKYNISFYHPGTYYLFNKDEDEYHAWSCCMNENKVSKGCCKRIEKIPLFNYDIIM